MSEPGSILTWTTTAWAIPGHPPAGRAPALVSSLASTPVKTDRTAQLIARNATVPEPATATGDDQLNPLTASENDHSPGSDGEVVDAKASAMAATRASRVI